MQPRPFPLPTARRLLGEQQIPISPFILGSVREPEVVPAAFDAGINAFFLTADMHWPLYEGLRRGLEMLFARGGGVREQVCVMVVSYVTQPEFTWMPFHEVIDAVRGLETIDVTVMGGVYAQDFQTRLPHYLEHQQGKVPGVRAVAATFHDRKMSVEALGERKVDLGLIRYNPGHRGAEKDVFPFAHARSALLYNFNSTRGSVSKGRFAELGLNDDYWHPEVPDYYRFALTSGAFDGLLLALRTQRELRESLDGISKGPLTEEEVQFMSDLAELRDGRATLATD